jgi:hypothetical protein
MFEGFKARKSSEAVEKEISQGSLETKELEKILDELSGRGTDGFEDFYKVAGTYVEHLKKHAGALGLESELGTLLDEAKRIHGRITQRTVVRNEEIAVFANKYRAMLEELNIRFMKTAGRALAA